MHSKDVATDPRHALGRVGEELAVRHLERGGYAILARGARTGAGEVDVVAFAQDTIVFVEVKARRAGARARDEQGERGPFDAIDHRKRARVRRAGAAWLSEHAERPLARNIRFDAIGVIIDGAGRVRSLEHLEGAF
jgi:putative endonuclease